MDHLQDLKNLPSDFHTKTCPSPSSSVNFLLSKNAPCSKSAGHSQRNPVKCTASVWVAHLFYHRNEYTEYWNCPTNLQFCLKQLEFWPQSYFRIYKNLILKWSLNFSIPLIVVCSCASIVLLSVTPQHLSSSSTYRMQHFIFTAAILPVWIHQGVLAFMPQGTSGNDNE